MIVLRTRGSGLERRRRSDGSEWKVWIGQRLSCARRYEHKFNRRLRVIMKYQNVMTIIFIILGFTM